jgi:hypothetical protein
LQRRRSPDINRSIRHRRLRRGAVPEDRKPMLGEIHDVLHEFPELEGKIDEMRANDAAFAKLMDEYDALDARVRKLEELGTPVADETIEDLKKERLLLKDRLYDLLRN